jgi:hypothetical protein
MYLRFLGKEVTAGGDKYKMFQEVGVHYPLQMEREIGDRLCGHRFQLTKKKMLCKVI